MTDSADTWAEKMHDLMREHGLLPDAERKFYHLQQGGIRLTSVRSGRVRIKLRPERVRELVAQGFGTPNPSEPSHLRVALATMTEQKARRIGRLVDECIAEFGDALHTRRDVRRFAPPRLGLICPTCNIKMPLNGRCDECGYVRPAEGEGNVGSEQDLRSLARAVSRCPLVDVARADARHNCHKVVSVQSSDAQDFQVPEAWAGNLEEASVVFLSSNPSISEVTPERPLDLTEEYPRASWEDDRIVDFVMHRFGEASDAAPATIDGRHRRFDGTYSTPVPFWGRIRDRASEVLGFEARADRDYVMTEVVHCKSKAEKGVAKAAETCGDLWLDAILQHSRAALVVVVGAKARDRLAAVAELPSGFGGRALIGEARRQVAAIELGGMPRLVVYLPHPTGMEKVRTFTQVYGAGVEVLRAVALGQRSVESALDELAAGG